MSAVPERTLELFPGFDYGIVGEGERSYLDLIARLGERRRRHEPSPASSIATASGVRVNPRAPYLDGDELDRLPPPAWDLLPDFPLRFQPNVFNYRAHAGRERRHVARLSVLVHVLRPLHVRPARPVPRRRVRRGACAGGSPISACGTSSSTTTSSR